MVGRADDRRAADARSSRPATCRRSTCAPASRAGRSTSSRGRAKSATRPGRTTPGRTRASANLWSLISADEELGLAYLPLTSPTNDMYGGHRLGQQSVQRHARLRQVRDRRARLALPDRAPRSLGLRPAGGADPRRHHGRRPADQGRRAGHEAGVRVRVRSHERHSRCGRSKSGRCRVRHAGRAHVADAAVSHQAAAVRSAGRLDRRPDRLHAGAARARRSSSSSSTGSVRCSRRRRFEATARTTRKGTVQLPGSVGGADWQGAAFDPETGMLYVAVDHRPVRRRPRQRRSEANRSRLRARPARLSAGPAGAAAAQAAVRPHHRHRSEQGRHRVDGRRTATARGTIRC